MTTADLAQIPTHLIAGPLGAGKTTLLRQLMAQRPADEQWAVLINEFGQVGIDAALLHGESEGVQLAEIPGGCLCCVNGLPFQVGLGRLLRRARPQRLFIEASGLGHPQVLMEQLAAAPWRGVLALQPLIMVLDAPRAWAGFHLADAQQQALPLAGLVLLNKSEQLTEEQQAALVSDLAPLPAICCSHGSVALSALPVDALVTEAAGHLVIPPSLASPGDLWRDVEDWHCHVQQQGPQTSIGWKMHPGQTFALDKLRQWLSQGPWQRAKGILHTDQGWLALNALAGEAPVWQPSAWRRDNRVELITEEPVEPKTLEAALRTAVIPQPPDQRNLS